MTVARRLTRNFGALACGADVAFFNTLPKAAGLSTSSALIVAIFMVLAETNELENRPAFAAEIADPFRLAGYMGAVENGRPFGALAGDAGVGTFGGSEDHTAILLSRPDQLTCYRYHPVAAERRLALPQDLVFVIAASGIAAAKTGAARQRYNRAAHLVSEIVAMAHGRDPAATLADIIDTAPAALADLRTQLAGAEAACQPDLLLRRLEHFVLEDRQILPAALEAVAAGRLDAFGELVDRSQRAAQDLLGNQVPETVTLARLARDLGAHAASSFGAGFGGSVWALVDRGVAESFTRRWLRQYATWHPAAAHAATAFVTRPAAGAFGAP
jgi:galactokinase